MGCTSSSHLICNPAYTVPCSHHKADQYGIMISFLYFKHHEYNVLELLSTPEIKADDSILWLYVAIRYVALLQWHENQYALSVEEMAAKYLRMLKQPIIQDPA